MRFFGGVIGDMEFLRDDLTDEVGEGDVDMLALDLYTNEISGGRGKTIDTWTSATFGVYLAMVVDEPFFTHLVDNSGHGRYAQIEFFRQFWNCRCNIVDVIFDDGFFDKGIFTAFLDF